MKKNELMEAMDGEEVWTNAFGGRFGERVCAMIDNDTADVWVNGKKFKPTAKEVKELWEDSIIQEFGSREEMNRQIEAEFGGAQ